MWDLGFRGVFVYVCSFFFFFFLGGGGEEWWGGDFGV